jgi:16S rRNA (guanine966-N2)-methyltransferase
VGAAPTRPRLTGGHARGRPLATPVPEGARPTAARVREALFSVVGQDLAGVRVLDAFGGSGLLALEAWSRGAEVTVVERDRAAADAISANVAALGASVQVVVGDVLATAVGRYHLLLVDPPYAAPVEPVLRALAAATLQTLVLEHDAAVEPPAQVPGLALARTRAYGGTALSFYVVDP